MTSDYSDFDPCDTSTWSEEQLADMEKRFPASCCKDDSKQIRGAFGKWIPFSENIPDDENDILVTDGRYVDSALWQFDGLHFESGDDDGFAVEVTHWMRYPDPPVASNETHEIEIELKPVRLMTKRELRAELSMLRDYVNQLCPKGFDQILANMTDEERIDHLKHQLAYIKSCQTADTFGSMLIIFGDNQPARLGSTFNPENTPKTLRKLADRIENGKTENR